MKKIYRITESQLNNVVEKLINEATPEGNTNSRPSKLEFGFTDTLNASTFKNGVDIIDSKNPKVINVINKLKNIKPEQKVIVLGSASSVGTSQGYDNKSLALRRANNFLTIAKSAGIDTSKFIVDSRVDTTPVKINSPEAIAQQYVKITVKKDPKIESAIDNTAVEKPNGIIKPIVKPENPFAFIKVPKKNLNDILDLLRKNGYKFL